MQSYEEGGRSMNDKFTIVHTSTNTFVDGNISREPVKKLYSWIILRTFNISWERGGGIVGIN